METKPRMLDSEVTTINYYVPLDLFWNFGCSLSKSDMMHVISGFIVRFM